MATLAKPRTVVETTINEEETDIMLAGVPAPFPVGELELARQSEDDREREVAEEEQKETDDPFMAPEERQARVEAPFQPRVLAADDSGTAFAPRNGEQVNELMPSITTLQKSCIMTLNNILSTSMSLDTMSHPQSPSQSWKSIVPDRRHSMPNTSLIGAQSGSSTATTSVLRSPADSATSEALQTLISNLRARTSEEDDRMIEIRQGPSTTLAVPFTTIDTDTTSLLFELRERTTQLGSTLSPRDAALTHSLVTLLSYFDRLSVLQQSMGANVAEGEWDTATPRATDTPREPDVDVPPPIDVFDALTRHLNDVQLDRLLNQPLSPTTATTATTAKATRQLHQVESSILWAQIDKELENVVTMCKERTRFHPHEGLPPKYEYSLDTYDYLDDADLESLPEYDGTGRLSLEDSRSIIGGKLKEKGDRSDIASMAAPTSTSAMDEKMRLDLEGVAMAIDRLYLVAPQLHNQRVELNAGKLEKLAKLERDRAAGSLRSKGKGKEKERDVKELETILEMLGRAGERSLKDQSVVLDGEAMKSRLEKAKARDEAQKAAFVQTLLQHSSAGRMKGQDAVLHPPKVKDPEAMLTLPEFIRERIPLDSELLRGGGVMLSLPEIVAQEPDDAARDKEKRKEKRKSGGASSITSNKSSKSVREDEHEASVGHKNKEKEEKREKDKDKKSSRSRSLSAPPLSWLKHSRSLGNLAKGRGGASNTVNMAQHPLPTVNGGVVTVNGQKQKESAFDVVYVAEHHSNLHHVLVFFTLTEELPPNANLIAEVLPPFPEHHSQGGDQLVIRSVVSPSSGSSWGGTWGGRSGGGKPGSRPGSRSGLGAADSVSGSRGDGGSENVVWSSLPLALPARTAPGRKEVRMQSGHWEIKMPTIRQETNGSRGQTNGQVEEHQKEDYPDALRNPLLDATQLEAASPTSFVCASCSLPIIVPGPSANNGTASPPLSPLAYRDLPSEHWEELVEAWMCHPDQKLHETVMKHARGNGRAGNDVQVKVGAGGRESRGGFWPRKGQCFVGGSYLLFERSVMVTSNMLLDADENREQIHDNWKQCRCLCGAVIGRSQDREIFVDHGGGDDESDRECDVEVEVCYRILKYAIRPVAPGHTELLKIPLSAFIVDDMMEYVQAHATYRFVVRDEEDERPRILVWLFKPRIRLSYTTPKSRALPKNASITAAKVLFKLIGPSEAGGEIKTLLNKYPGFPQAEYLSYPMAVCMRLAALLKESSSAYPESLRTMTGLEVGWLHRR
ncbi:hypothetical protein FA15DRAFT_670172 [Coprinopsis marcescibilis]|uniref:HECT-like ubiquitin-conjugating enzyme-binding-domain-containing protein n=1 Tax=Coprinopsis marcescibilis TaxID=230819 RepID=A0A5C3KT92_COPMA|nr:hypothetical protein FA15DRAFT_670172 [Coprinopsis marcescibilis]